MVISKNWNKLLLWNSLTKLLTWGLLTLVPLSANAQVHCPKGKPVTNPDFLENWMGYMQPYLQDVTLFDMSLPGTHDSLTYYLSTHIAEAAPDSSLIQVIDSVLGDVKKGDVIPDFIRDQAQSQTLSITEQLDSGARFLDLRITYQSRKAKYKPSRMKWYGYHFVITKHSIKKYLKKIGLWLGEHPTEMVVLWVSHHGDNCQADFPDASSSAYMQLSQMLMAAFGDKLVSPGDGPINSTTYNEYRAKGRQVLLYLSSFDEFKANIPSSFDACPSQEGQIGGGINNNTNVQVTEEGEGFICQLIQFQDGQTKQTCSLNSRILTHKSLKKAGTLQLVSGASSGTKDLVASQAAVQVAEWLRDGISDATELCQDNFSFPGNSNSEMNCPGDLLDLGRMTNFYNQRSMNHAVKQMESEASGGTQDDIPWRMPMAMYLDGMLSKGRYDTSTSSTNSAYAYVGAMLQSAAIHNGPCEEPGKTFPTFNCSDVDNAISQLLTAAPYCDYSDPAEGRVEDWPRPIGFQ